MAKYKICPVCGARNLPTVFECVQCEADLTGEKVLDENSEQSMLQQEEHRPRVNLSKEGLLRRICSECGHKNPPNARKCAACGEDISDIVPTAGPGLSEDEEPNSAVFTLRSVDGEYDFRVPDGETVIGRASAMREYLGMKQYVSRTHAKLVARGNDLYVENLSTTNRTFVNNKQISSITRLKAGDEVGLGGICVNGDRQNQAAYFIAEIHDVRS